MGSPWRQTAISNIHHKMAHGKLLPKKCTEGSCCLLTTLNLFSPTHLFISIDVTLSLHGKDIKPYEKSIFRISF